MLTGTKKEWAAEQFSLRVVWWELEAWPKLGRIPVKKPSHWQIPWALMADSCSGDAKVEIPQLDAAVWETHDTISEKSEHLE